MKALDSILIWILAAGSLVCFLFLGDFEAVYATAGFTSDGWEQILHLSANSFHPWRSDDAVSSLYQWLMLPESFLAEALFFSFFLAISVAALLSALEGSTISFLTLGLGVLFSGLSLILFGADTIVLSVLLYFSFFIFTLEKSVDAPDNSLQHWTLVAAAAALLAQASSYLAPILVIVAVFLYARRISWAFLIVPVALSFGALFLAPAVTFPSYPLLARVVPDDGIEGMLRPLVGADSPLPIMDREFSRNVFPIPTLVLLLLAVTTYFIAALREYHPIAKRLALAAALFALMLFWDTGLPEKVSIIGPFASLKRILPGGGFFVFLNSIWFALSFLLLLLSAGLLRRLSVVVAFSVAIIAFPVLANGMFAQGSAAVLQTFGRSIPLQTIKDPSLKKQLVSPSYSVVRRAGVEVLIDRDLRQNLSAFALPNSVELKAFPEGANLEKLRDGDLRTRWSARPGQQRGDEWIQLKFPQEELVEGLEMATGGFPWDFPRGIQVLGSKSCSSGVNFDAYQLIYESTNWLGAINYTKAGYPYFSGQGDVRVVFSSGQRLACLLIRQVGSTEHYDWSVAEIRILKQSN